MLLLQTFYDIVSTIFSIFIFVSIVFLVHHTSTSSELPSLKYLLHYRHV